MPAALEEKLKQDLLELSRQLTTRGVVVRREKLRQGPGWKVLSGSCRLNRDRLLFIDKSLPLQEQVDLLSAAIAQLPAS